MYYGKRPIILTWAAAVLAGVLLHFLYRWLPSAGTALFSPTNESLWEHVKLVFWPYLAAALLLNRDRPGGIRPWLLVLPFLCAGTLVLGYLYHIWLGGESMAVDIAIFLLVMALGFWLPPLFSGPFRGIRWAIPILLTALLAALIAVFTLWPPDHVLFADLSSANTWTQLPC